MLVIQTKKTVYNTKINEIKKKITDHDHDKYITTQELNQLTAEIFTARLAKANLQKQSSCVLQKWYSDKFQKIHRKTPTLQLYQKRGSGTGVLL